jgi:hypothetical protein
LRRHGMWERIGGNLRIDPEKLIAAGWQPLHDTRGGLTALAHVLTHAAKDKRAAK